MTGEITLTGRVLPVGGLKEKALAAHRGGIKYVVAPLGNKAEWHELPNPVRAEMEFMWVETMDQVLNLTLRDAVPSAIVPTVPQVTRSGSARPVQPDELRDNPGRRKHPTSELPALQSKRKRSSG